MKANLDDFKERQNAKAAPKKEKNNAQKLSIRDSLSNLVSSISTPRPQDRRASIRGR